MSKVSHNNFWAQSFFPLLIFPNANSILSQSSLILLLLKYRVILLHQLLTLVEFPSKSFEGLAFS